MKVAVTGKGGVGKTSFSSLLAGLLAREGRRPLAIDADPDTNLADSLGFPDAGGIVPIAEMKEMIAERMGTTPDSIGTFFKLNPRVSDIPDMFMREREGVRLIVMGMVKRGGAGCACPENAFLKVLLSHVLLGQDEDVVVDLEAGLEHLGRGTVAEVDGLAVVVEPTLRSLDTLFRVDQLAQDIGLKRIWPVANKIESEEDREFLQSNAPNHDFVGWLPYSRDVVKAHRGQMPVRDVEDKVWKEVESTLERMRRDIASAGENGSKAPKGSARTL